jgi:hypothetical protein
LEWIKKKGNKSTCYWPDEDVAENATALVNLITNKRAVVDKENWTVLNVTIIAKLGKFLSLRQFFLKFIHIFQVYFFT